MKSSLHSGCWSRGVQQGSGRKSVLVLVEPGSKWCLGWALSPGTRAGRRPGGPRKTSSPMAGTPRATHLSKEGENAPQAIRGHGRPLPRGQTLGRGILCGKWTAGHVPHGRSLLRPLTAKAAQPHKYQFPVCGGDPSSGESQQPAPWDQRGLQTSKEAWVMPTRRPAVLVNGEGVCQASNSDGSTGKTWDRCHHTSREAPSWQRCAWLSLWGWMGTCPGHRGGPSLPGGGCQGSP